MVPTSVPAVSPLEQLPALATFSLIALGVVAPLARAARTDAMTRGKLGLKSMSQLAFGPKGILFVADTQAAAIVARATGDTTPVTRTAVIRAVAGQT